jgi:hypothetical protein
MSPIGQFLVVATVVVALACAVLTQRMAGRRGQRGPSWFLMGLLLGPLAFPLVWLLAGRHPIHDGQSP